METISVRFEETFVRDIERVMKHNRYATKTEFIREAVRNQIKDLEKGAALERLRKAYGAGAKNPINPSQEDIHRAGEKAVREIAAKLGVNID